MSNLVLVLARNPRLMFSFSFSEENNLVLKVFWFFGQRVDTLFMILEKKENCRRRRVTMRRKPGKGRGSLFFPLKNIVRAMFIIKILHYEGVDSYLLCIKIKIWRPSKLLQPGKINAQFLTFGLKYLANLAALFS